MVPLLELESVDQFAFVICHARPLGNIEDRPSGIRLLNLCDALAVRHPSNGCLEEVHPVAGERACLI